MLPADLPPGLWLLPNSLTVVDGWLADLRTYTPDQLADITRRFRIALTAPNDLHQCTVNPIVPEALAKFRALGFTTTARFRTIVGQEFEVWTSPEYWKRVTANLEDYLTRFPEPPGSPLSAVVDLEYYGIPDPQNPLAVWAGRYPRLGTDLSALNVIADLNRNGRTLGVLGADAYIAPGNWLIDARPLCIRPWYEGTYNYLRQDAERLVQVLEGYLARTRYQLAPCLGFRADLFDPANAAKRGLLANYWSWEGGCFVFLNTSAADYGRLFARS